MESALAKALVEAQKELKNPKKDSENPFFSSKYLSLAGLLEAVLPVYTVHGIAVAQDITSDAAGIACKTMLIHESGEAMSFGPMTIPVNKADAQAFGSAVSYARRYHLQAVAGISAEDDDGNKAVANSRPPVQTPTAAPAELLSTVVSASTPPKKEGRKPYVVSTPEGDFSTFDQKQAEAILPGAIVIYKKTRFGLDVVEVKPSTRGESHEA